MAYVIALPCIGVKDTACLTVCPVDCIHPTTDEPGFAAAEMLHIDPASCIDCDLCAAECPAKAIYPQAALPHEWSNFLHRNAAYFENQ